MTRADVFRFFVNCLIDDQALFPQTNPQSDHRDVFVSLASVQAADLQVDFDRFVLTGDAAALEIREDDD